MDEEAFRGYLEQELRVNAAAQYSPCSSHKKFVMVSSGAISNFQLFKSIEEYFRADECFTSINQYGMGKVIKDKKCIALITVTNHSLSTRKTFVTIHDLVRQN